jgi:hypothetical protein
MKTSPDSSIILIENPLCGNVSLAAAMKLEDSAAPRFSKPREARAAIGSDAWKKATKILLVRSVDSRFESAATYALAHIDELPEQFRDFFHTVKEIKSAAGRGKAILEWLATVPDLDRPVIFQQQKNWMAKFDLVLCTDDIALYFNVSKKPTVHRLNIISRNPKFEHVAIPQDKRGALLSAAYPDDVELLKRVLVWNPNPKTVRLVTGACASCQKKESGSSEDQVSASASPSFDGLDLTQGGLEEEPSEGSSAPPAEPEGSKPKPKAKK